VLQHFVSELATLATINSPVWGISKYGYGVIVEGIAAIRQRMDIAIRTTKGTDPLRPQFGSNVYRYVDYPINTAIPNIKRELLDCLDIWVKDVKVIAIKHSLKSPGNPVFEIFYTLVDDEIIDKLLFDLNAGVTISESLNEIILQAYFPPNPNAYRYQIKLFKNGNQVFPIPDPAGFETIAQLFTWVQNNYGYVGRWYLLSDSIVCYMNSEGVTSASLELSVLPIFVFGDFFPQLLPGEFYKVDMLVNGIAAAPAMPQTFTNPGEVLIWAQTNWSNYATWQVQYFLGDGTGVFTDEFSDEFTIQATDYKLVGVSNEVGFNAILGITKV
jgi:phage baseplate assembly protein W